MLFDTCALLWVTLDPDKLTKKELAIAHKCIEQGTACLSSISFWEIGIKIKKGSLNIQMTLESYIEKVQALNGFDIIPADEMIWMENLRLNWEHRDPADRTIVATAMRRSLPILTKDEIIKQFYANQGWK